MILFIITIPIRNPVLNCLFLMKFLEFTDKYYEAVFYAYNFTGLNEYEKKSIFNYTNPSCSNFIH